MGSACRRAVYQLSAATEISDLPATAAVGSIAYLADMSAVYVKDNDGTWIESTTAALALVGLI